jgi:Ca2+-binding RTX toxin-like protein
MLTVLLAIAAVGVSASGPAAAQNVPLGVWQGVDATDGSVVTMVVDEDDVGNAIFFAYDSVSEHCSGQQAAFGRGWQPDPANPLWHVHYDGVYCLDGTFVPLQDEYYELTLDGGIVLNVLTPEQASGQEPGGVQTFPLCRPDIDVEFELPPGWTLIEGTDGPDTINASKGNNIICGYGGNDRIWGRGGDDIVIGDLGDDELYGNNGIDILWGGPGKDVLYGGFHTDGVFGNCDEDEVRPQAGHDFGYGGNEDDILDGFFGHDRLEGGPGDDDAWGRNGNDFLLGGSGDDFLSGGAGPRDVIDGEAGSDTCNAETETNCEF